MKAAITCSAVHLCLLVVLGFLSSDGLAQVARTEVIPVPTVTRSDQSS